MLKKSCRVTGILTLFTWSLLSGNEAHVSHVKNSFFTVTVTPRHYFSTLLFFSLELQLKVLCSTESRIACQMGNVFFFVFFVIGVNNMISIILILTLYFFNLTSEYSNCICHHFPVHNCFKHKSRELCGKDVCNFPRKSLCQWYSVCHCSMRKIANRNECRDSGVSLGSRVNRQRFWVWVADLKYYWYKEFCD